jgi:hypothetical protein
VKEVVKVLVLKKKEWQLLANNIKYLNIKKVKINFSPFFMRCNSLVQYLVYEIEAYHFDLKFTPLTNFKT